MKKEIGIRVKSARNARGLTQIDLADTIDKSFETISNIERGKTAPNFTTLQEIADALRVELKYFFDFADPAATAHRTRLKSELDATALEVDDRQLALINELARAVANAK
ncbi:helix-turn-helix domain-containing protein [Roseobacteraceae bacterium S113]